MTYSRKCRVGVYIAASACVLAASPIARGGEADIVLTRKELLGNQSSAEQCAATPSSVWVTAYGKSFCIRYYLSTAGGTGKAAFVFLGGDQGELTYTTWAPGTVYLSNYPDGGPPIKFDWSKYVEGRSRQVSGPAIVLARMGLDGSSGSHYLRGTLMELNVMNAALNAIKARHGFEEFHLGGYSGGGTLVGGLIALRSDIGCAVPGSGRLADVTMRNRYAPNAPFQTFDAMKSAPILAKNKRLRIIVITDPNDKQVTRDHQDKFVQAVRRSGGTVEQYYVKSPDLLHHATGAFVPTALAYCIQHKSSDEIQKAMQRISQNLSESP